jgi:hypothetical protein
MEAHSYRGHRDLVKLRTQFEKDIVNEGTYVNKTSKPWTFYDRNVDDYNGIFKNVLDASSFADIFSSAKYPSVFDAFAPVTFVRDLINKTGMGYGIALGLCDFRNEWEIQNDIKANIEYIYGYNFFESRKWLPHINSYLHKHNLEGFDVITCIPEDGGLTIPSDEGIFSDPSHAIRWIMVNRLWQLLATNGQLYVDLNIRDIRYQSTGYSPNPEVEYAKNWINLLTCRGIDNKIHETNRTIVLKLKKRDDSPIILPYLI